MSAGSRFGGVDGGPADQPRAEDKWSLASSPLSAEMTPLHALPKLLFSAGSSTLSLEKIL